MALNREVMSFNVSNKGRDCTTSKQMEDGAVMSLPLVC